MESITKETFEKHSHEIRLSIHIMNQGVTASQQQTPLLVLADERIWPKQEENVLSSTLLVGVCQ
jgi:hypothetical protein